jgi:hypothetical protein
VKSHQMTYVHCADLVAKYIRLGFHDLVLVAPSAHSAGERLLAASHRPRVQFMRFAPDLEEVRSWYVDHWARLVPDWTHEALATGRHYVRFILAGRTMRGGYAVGQTRSRVYRTDTIGEMMLRLPFPPVRILWSPQRFTTPRDLGARGSSMTALGGYVAVDVDGDRLHRARHSCEITAQQPYCVACERYAWREISHLLSNLHGVEPVALVTSGGRGLHAYFADDGTTRHEILRTARTLHLRIDEGVTTSCKTTIALPGSLNAGAMLPVTAVDHTPGMPQRQEVTAC